MTLIGIDTGGTFTDFVLWRDGEIRIHKVLSTPDAPERAILQGIAELGLDPRDLAVVHGSTVATNAVLEGKGVRTLYVANRGLKDVLAIGRQARPDLYDLQPPPRKPPVPRELCIETGGRLAADGTWVEPLTQADLDAFKDRVEELAPEAVAINLLFSYLDDSAERALADALPGHLFVSRSSEVLPLTGEYERGIATWINAWVGPVVAGYLERLAAGLPGARISVMQSSGEAVAADQTAGHAARLLLSGPAGGLAGAAFAAAAEDCVPRLLSFDMGGTSTDVALIDGEPRLTTSGRIAGYPIALPMVDMHTIGAGGGSLAQVDAGGILLVGPESAGASPGPACYGRGGARPTVTDANLVLGRLDPEGFLGGRMRLDVDAAREAVRGVASQLALSVEETALGIVRIANEHMARALRVISVQRGLDPRDFVLTSFGGAGGLHVCALAEALGMTQALVPVHAGVLSALGMLVTPAGRTLTKTHLGLIAELGEREVSNALQALADAALAELAREGWEPEAIRIERSLDLRYRGQSHTLNLPWRSVEAAVEGFHARHQAAYGHRLELPVELVNLRVRARAPAPALRLPELRAAGGENPPRVLSAYGCEVPVRVISRSAVARGAGISGPAIIADDVSTTWLAPGWAGRLDRRGNLLLSQVTD
ncbi:hydantoinase/oxoprolinase family protein [Thiorhodococcus mannitoliphagus]|uniref:Hydantoinase/oxoprolinase family protein n=1 Tax=Thiorhodococcus mannitoliphagus TaxID=329406 RepID=A0A6P1DLL6_9GAMM|nr:hydantoinase/oxoprolinase family protein [Thiorhodococcus mannitoliphagus]NEX18809.1 hydantoinase/oxoprolinase family protein [Thiorhodococcus mannitoliphagus]